MIDLKSGQYIVLGDLMVDEYNYGEVTRISPEAPVPILKHNDKILFPGGAANVAMNLKGLENSVELVGILGNDEDGNWLRNYLNKSGIGTHGIVMTSEVSTIKKVRFRTKVQSLLRVDYESLQRQYCSYAATIIKYIDEFLINNITDGVVVSDYNKGMIPDTVENNPYSPFFDKILKKNIICGSDTKKEAETISLYCGFDFLKPNKIELSKVIKRNLISANLKRATYEYLMKCKAKAVYLTLGDEGIYYNNSNNEVFCKAIKTRAVDVTGAGDTVFAVLMNCLGSNMDIETSLKLANLAASIVIQYSGTKTITKSELLRRF